MRESWTRYKLFDDILSKIMYFEKFVHETAKDGGRVSFEFTQEDESLPHISIKFDWSYSYRYADEAFLLKSDAEADFPDGERGSLLIVENSTYLCWFNEEKYGPFMDRVIVHYKIVTPNECFDILTDAVPEITLLESSS